MQQTHPAQVRGEGGSIAPAFVIPMDIELDPRPADERVALVRLEVSLGLAGPPAQVRLGTPVVVFGDGAGGGVWATSTASKFQTRVELRFPVTAAVMRLVEEIAHADDTLDWNSRSQSPRRWLMSSAKNSSRSRSALTAKSTALEAPLSFALSRGRPLGLSRSALLGSSGPTSSRDSDSTSCA